VMFKKTDSWEYFFDGCLKSCHKNREGSKIIVTDDAGRFVLFNFLKHVDHSKDAMVPCNRSKFFMALM
jgi:hypothetical protein